MKRITLGVTGALACLAALVVARQDQGAPPSTFLTGARQAPASGQPTFRGRADLVQLDVSVIDSKRHPVRGLKASDFTVLEEGQARPIQTFVEMDMPEAATKPAKWQIDVPYDVTSNQSESGRLIVIVIDDNGLMSQKPTSWAVRKTLAVARGIVADLGPKDMAAVIYSLDNRTAQSLTHDRQRLLAAIDNSRVLRGALNSSDEVAACRCGLCSIEVLGDIAEKLRAIEGQHKTIFFISGGFSIRPTNLECFPEQSKALENVFRQAQLANVTIHPFDPNGLSTPASIRVGGFKPQVEYLKQLANMTGSRAVVDDNDPDRQVADTLNESRSYYLLGFSPAVASSTDGKLRRVEVRVNRHGVDVRTRSGFYPTVVSAGAAAAPASLDAATSGLLAKADIPMQAAVAPFAGSDAKATLAVVLGVSQPPRETSAVDRARPPASQENATIMARLFDHDGQALGMQRLTVALVDKPDAAGNRAYEAMMRLPVAPGRYEIRLGLETAEPQTASVYTYAEVPDFAREPLAMSGLVLSASPSPAAAPKDAFADFLPLVPTSRREFRSTDRLTAFVRVYQGGSRPLAPVAVVASVVNTSNRPVSEGRTQLAPEAFEPHRAADYKYEVPLQKMPVGEYLLTISASTGAAKADRALRFKVN